MFVTVDPPSVVQSDGKFCPIIAFPPIWDRELLPAAAISLKLYGLYHIAALCHCTIITAACFRAIDCELLDIFKNRTVQSITKIHRRGRGGCETVRGWRLHIDMCAVVQYLVQCLLLRVPHAILSSDCSGITSSGR